MDIKFYEVFSEEEAVLKKHLPSLIHAEFTREAIQESKDREPPAKLLSIRTQSAVPLRWAANIKGVLTRSQGYDHLSNYLRRVDKRVACGFLPDYCARAVAEHVIMSMFFLLRKTKKQLTNFETFNRENITGQQCLNKKILIVGVGKIGTEVAGLAKGLQMQVKGVDNVIKNSQIEYISLADGVCWADIVVCALPLTEQTKGILDYNLFKNIKKGSIFINISRGEISPIKDIQKLLSEKILGAVSLDVYPNEKELAEKLRAGDVISDESHKIILELKDREDVFFTPHNAFNTEESVEKKAEKTVKEVINFLEKGRFINSVEK